MKVMNSINEAPQGINVVVEMDSTVYIGRLGKSDGKRVNMHHAAVFRAEGDSAEQIIRKTARFGVPVKHTEVAFEAKDVRRVRALGEVPKA